MGRDSRPHDSVTTALIDAVATGPVLDTGGVDRTAVECAAAMQSLNENFVMLRVRVDHPETNFDDDEGKRYNAVEEARRLLAVEGTAWLLENGYFRAVGTQGLTLSKPFKLVSKESYVPGAHREESLRRSLRRVTQKRLDLLRESIARLGDLREYFPILLDEDEKVVDGRHRRAIDPEWPSMPHRVPRADAVAVAAAANRSNAWTAEDWDRLKMHAQFVDGQRLAQKEVARLALLENHERPSRAIARLVGCHEKTVRQVRNNLEDTAGLPRYRPPGGQPRKDGAPSRRRVPEALEEEVLELVKNGEPVSRSDLSQRYGVGEHIVQLAHQRAIGAVEERDRLAASKPTPEPASAVASELEPATATSTHSEPETPPPPDATPCPPAAASPLTPELADDEFETAHLILDGTPTECGAQLRRMVSNAWRAKFKECL